MARVLFLTQVLPYPLDSGAKTRAYYVLRYLAERHDVTLMSFVRPEDPAGAVTHLRGICAAVECVPMRRSLVRTAMAGVRAAVTGLPALIARDETPEMSAALRSLLTNGGSGKQFDVIHADQTSMAQHALYARAVQQLSGTRPRVALDAHNALYRILQQSAGKERNPVRRLVLRREARAMECYERRLPAGFDAVTFVSEADRAALGALNAPVIPICVDPDERPAVESAPEQDLILHIGTMFWPPNIQGVLWFTREVLPLVRERVPAARLAVIGRRPPAAVQALANDPGIEIAGYVADPTAYLARSAAFIVPLHAGAGMRVKIPDAWCWGVPIVSTSLGAEGIHVRDGEDILLADAPGAFAEAVVRLLQGPGLRARLRAGGLRAVRERYGWRTVYAAWDDVYARLLAE